MALRKEDLYAGMIYAHEDYMRINSDDARYELIDGDLYFMATPTFKHQEVSMNLSILIGNHLKGKDCKVYAAPMSVRLKQENRRDTTLQPDLAVICDMSKITDGKVCIGAPELVIEILSPSTARLDKFIKLEKYLQNGAHEYWIVDADSRGIQIFTLGSEGYLMKGYCDDDVIVSRVLPGLEIPLLDIFGSEDTQVSNEEE